MGSQKLKERPRLDKSPIIKSRHYLAPAALILYFAWALVGSSFRSTNAKGVFMDHEDIALVVPSSYKDFNCFSQRFLGHLYYHVLDVPKKVVIVVSGVPVNATLEYPQPPSQLDMDLQVLQYHTVHNAARNRNLGALAVSTEIISFFDIDDLPHRQRFSVIQQLFSKYPTKAAMFSHLYATKLTSQILPNDLLDLENLDSSYCHLEQRPCYDLDYYNDPNKYVSMFQHWDSSPNRKLPRWCCMPPQHRQMKGSPAPGWSTFHRKTFMNYRFDESYTVGEDGNILGRMIADGINFTFWDIVLGYHEPSSSRIGECE